MKKYSTSIKGVQDILKSENFIISNDTDEINIYDGSVSDLLILNKEDKKLTINIYKDSHINIYDVVLTSCSTNLNIEVYLKEEGATCNITSLIFGSADANINSNIQIFHEVSNSFSDLNCYCISKDKSSIKLSNSAYIKQKAKGAVAKQHSKGLTLSESSSISALPCLYIDEFDVSASHGVAMGSLNKDDLFYLMSRGLSYNDASMIVIMGFVEPIIKQIDEKKYCLLIKDKFNKLLK